MSEGFSRISERQIFAQIFGQPIGLRFNRPNYTTHQ